ncbi:MAG: hypothetical protein ABJR05_05230 [Balneola sp.]
MEVKLYFERGPGASTIENIVRKAVTDFASQMGVSLESIRTVALAGDDDYKRAVKELFDSDSFTNNDYFVGVGKSGTIYNNGYPEHTILIKSIIFDWYIQGCYTSSLIEEWEPEHQMAPYIISHELGHCKDNTIRSKISGAVGDQYNTFNLDEIHRRNYSILQEEFSACFHAVSFYSRDQYHYELANEKEAFSRAYKKLVNFKNDKDDADQISNVAWHASGLLWSYIVQFCKLWVGKKKTEFEKDKIPSLIDGLPFLGERFSKLVPTLEEWFYIYPNLPQEASNFLYIWYDLIEDFDVRFSENAQGWCCFWK